MAERRSPRRVVADALPWALGMALPYGVAVVIFSVTGASEPWLWGFLGVLPGLGAPVGKFLRQRRHDRDDS